MKIKTALITAVALVFVLVFQEAAAQESGLSRKRTGQLSEKALVKKALAGFIYGVQHNMPGIAREYYAPDKMLRASSDAEKSDEVCSTAMRMMKSVEGDPIVMIAKPRITFQDGKANVDCCLIWHFQNESNEIIRLTKKEHFVLARNDMCYTIIESKLASVVFTHWNSRKSLEAALHEDRAQEEVRD